MANSADFDAIYAQVQGLKDAESPNGVIRNLIEFLQRWDGASPLVDPVFNMLQSVLVMLGQINVTVELEPLRLCFSRALQKRALWRADQIEMLKSVCEQISGLIQATQTTSPTPTSPPPSDVHSPSPSAIPKSVSEPISMPQSPPPKEQSSQLGKTYSSLPHNTTAHFTSPISLPSSIPQTLPTPVPLTPPSPITSTLKHFARSSASHTRRAIRPAPPSNQTLFPSIVKGQISPHQSPPPPNRRLTPSVVTEPKSLQSSFAAAAPVNSPTNNVTPFELVHPLGFVENFYSQMMTLNNSLSQVQRRLGQFEERFTGLETFVRTTFDQIAGQLRNKKRKAEELAESNKDEDGDKDEAKDEDNETA